MVHDVSNTPMTLRWQHLHTKHLHYKYNKRSTYTIVFYSAWTIFIVYTNRTKTKIIYQYIYIYFTLEDIYIYTYIFTQYLQYIHATTPINYLEKGSLIFFRRTFFKEANPCSTPPNLSKSWRPCSPGHYYIRWFVWGWAHQIATSWR